MERMTEWSYLAGVKIGDLKAEVDEHIAFDLLAAYEGTGYMPEEFKEVVDALKAHLWDVEQELKAYKDTGLEPNQITELMAAHGTAILELSEYRLIGPKKHLQELAKAEKDGRLVVLPPIKIGDTAFFIINKRIYEGKVYYMRWEHHKSFGVRGNISADSYGGCVGAGLFDFGKTVFLTREEAEAALKKREEADHETD